MLARHDGRSARRAPRPTRATASSRTRRPTSPPAAPRPVVIGFGPCGIFARAAAGADGLAPDRPRARQGRARAHARTPGACGARRARSRIERAVRRGRRRHLLRRQAVEPDQRPAPPRRARCSTEFVKAGAPEEILYVAKPHIGTFRLVGVVEKMRADDRGARRRDPLRRSASTDLRSRSAGARRVRGVVLRRRRAASRRRPRRARPRPQRARHLRDAARARRVHRGQAVLDRLPHRAPAVADRPRALRPERRPSAARRRRLQAGAPRAATAARSTASACAPAAPWSRRRRSRAASSPTA